MCIVFVLPSEGFLNNAGLSIRDSAGEGIRDETDTMLAVNHQDKNIS